MRIHLLGTAIFFLILDSDLAGMNPCTFTINLDDPAKSPIPSFFWIPACAGMTKIG
jgi:hypothetical protein